MSIQFTISPFDFVEYMMGKLGKTAQVPRRFSLILLPFPAQVMHLASAAKLSIVIRRYIPLRFQI